MTHQRVHPDDLMVHRQVTCTCIKVNPLLKDAHRPFLGNNCLADIAERHAGSGNTNT